MLIATVSVFANGLVSVSRWRDANESNSANTKMKALLPMAARNAITFNAELKQYHQRKVAEGKNPVSVLNAVRFKLICRIFSVVKRGEEYRKDDKKDAA